MTLKLGAFSAHLVVLSAVGTAWAADAVQDVDPAPPEPVIEAPATGSAYIAARISGAFGDDTEFGAAGTTITTDYDTGYDLSAAVGYEFAKYGPIAFRAEAEIGYLSQDVDGHSVAGLGDFSGSDAFGETTAIYGLANGYVSYELGIFQPFATAGVGYGQLDFQGHGVTPTGVVLDDSGSGLAWQVGAGTEVAVTDTVSVDIGYRLFNIEDAGVTAADGTNSDVDFTSHQIRLGVKKTF